MKTIKSLNRANQVLKEDDSDLWVSDCRARVWHDGIYFCVQKDGIHVIRRKTFNAIWNYLYTR